MSEHVYLGATFTVWFIWNLVINIYNKWVLSFTGFHFPLALTMSSRCFVGLNITSNQE